MRRGRQHVLRCPYGRGKITALGLCATCYSLKRQDQQYFGGLREQVLARDRKRCRACGKPGTGKRTLVVHHRRPGTSLLPPLIALCPACNTRVTRTLVLARDWHQLLRLLWREQHPHAHEQQRLDFAGAPATAEPRGSFGVEAEPREEAATARIKADAREDSCPD